MTSPGGYQINPGLYRVPDLLTEEQFVDYMYNTYRRKIEFIDVENSVNPARALGQTAPSGVVDEDAKPHDFKDPVLRRINEMDFSPIVEEEEVKEEEKEETTKSTTRSSSKTSSK